MCDWPLGDHALARRPKIVVRALFAYLPVCRSDWLPVRPEPFAQGHAPLDLRLRTLPLLAAKAGSINQPTALFPPSRDLCFLIRNAPISRNGPLACDVSRQTSDTDSQEMHALSMRSRENAP